MADPTLQTFCCHDGRFNTDVAVQIMDEFDTITYNVVCMCSSLIGILGAIYQIWPRKIYSTSTNAFIMRGRRIIVWLAVADFFASLGIFIRSLVWLNFKRLMDVDNDTPHVIFCALAAAWTQYFYSATWLWTLCYAIDTFLSLKERDIPITKYHWFSWGLPAVFTSIGLSILYIPSAECHNINSLNVALLRVLPNYCATYLPIATVMIVNPIIYYSSSKHVMIFAFKPLSQITNRERDLILNIKLKFAMINIIFYCCWIPNIINGILLWTLWWNLPVKIIVSLWYFMAVMNPLQALFNAVIYRRWSQSKSNCMDFWCFRKREYELTDRSPLLRGGPPSRLHLSGNTRNNSINIASSI